MVDKENKIFDDDVINAENEQIKHQNLNYARKNKNNDIYDHIRQFHFFVYTAFDKLINAEDE